MKTKNNLTTGILLGIGVIVLPLILMGTTYTTEKQNKWEFHQGQGETGYNCGYLLNTENGEIFYLKSQKKMKSVLVDKWK